MADSGQQLGEPLLGSLQARAGHQHPRLRAGGGGRPRQPREAGNLPTCQVGAGVPLSAGDAAGLRPGRGRRSGGVPVPRVVPQRVDRRTQGPGLASSVLRQGRGWRGWRLRATLHPSMRCAPPLRRRWECVSRVIRARLSSAPPWCRPSSMASSPHGCYGRARRRRQGIDSTVMRPSGT